MPNPDKTLIVVVLDRSGSMNPVREATLSGLNEFLGSQREIPGETAVTLVQFDDKYELNFANTNLKDLKPLTLEQYVPRGMTALLDAIGRTIDETGRQLLSTIEANRPGKVIFVIQTDGEENASHEYNRQRVFDMITHQREKYAWEFVFLGANQDAIATATKLNIAAASALSYSSSVIGTRNAFKSAGDKIGSYRKGISLNTSFDAQDRTKALQDKDEDDLADKNAQTILDAFSGTPDSSKP